MCTPCSSSPGNSAWNDVPADLDTLHAVFAEDTRFFALLRAEKAQIAANGTQKLRLFLRIGGKAQHRDIFAPIEHPVTGCAIAHAHAQKRLFSRQRFSARRTGGKDQAARFQRLLSGRNIKPVSHRQHGQRLFA